MAKPRRPGKIEDVLERVRQKSKSGEYVPVEHAKLRMDQREVTDPEVRYVLSHGHREPKKDEFKDEHKAWNYSMRGKTADGRQLRIVVSFDSNDMLLITVIDLEK